MASGKLRSEKEQKAIFDALAVELAQALVRLDTTMPHLQSEDTEFVFKAGMGYFAEMLAKHLGMDVAAAAIDAMAEYGHGQVLQQAEATRH
jgi:hypothetical protein